MYEIRQSHCKKLLSNRSFEYEYQYKKKDDARSVIATGNSFKLLVENST